MPFGCTVKAKGASISTMVGPSALSGGRSGESGSSPAPGNALGSQLFSMLSAKGVAPPQAQQAAGAAPVPQAAEKFDMKVKRQAGDAKDKDGKDVDDVLKKANGVPGELRGAGKGADKPLGGPMAVGGGMPLEPRRSYPGRHAADGGPRCARPTLRSEGGESHADARGAADAVQLDE